MNKIVSTDFITDDVQRLVPVDATATTPKNAAVAKLMKAWEAKTTQRTAKGAGLTLMAVSLAACNDDSTTPDTGTDTGTTVVGQTFTLTASSVTGTFDAITGAAGADSMTGSVTFSDATSPVLSGSFEGGDSINGGDGADTLAITVTGGGATFTTGALPAALLTSVETLEIRSILTAAADILTIDMANFASLTGFVNNLSTNVVTVSNLVATDTVTVNGNGSVANGAFNAAYAAAATSSTINIHGDTTAHTITVTGGGVVTQTINSTGGTNVLTGFNSAATTEDVVITAATNLDLGTGISDIAAATGNSVTISGAATLVDLGSSAVDADIDTINASGMTAGGIEAVLNTSTTVVVTGGAGNDKITTGAVLTTGSVAAGAGSADELIITAGGTHVATAALGAKYTGFEVLTLADSQDVSLVSGITKINLAAATSESVTGLTAAQAANIHVTGDQTTAVTFALADATGTADALTLNLGTGLTTSASTDLSTSLVVTGFETLNLNTNQGPSATTANSVSTVGAITGATLTAINLTGGGFSIANAATTLATTINGSALTGVLTVGGDLIAGSTVTGGAGADLFTAGTNNGVTYTGNAGNDQLTATIAQLVATGTNDTAFAGGAGTDTVVVSDTAATLTDNHFTNLSGIEALTLSTGAISVTTGAAFNTAVDTAITITDGVTAATNTVTYALGLATDNITITSIGGAQTGAITEDVNITTGSGADTVTFSATGWVGVAGAAGELNISTGAGNDTISVTTGTLLAVTGVAPTIIIGGTGADTITSVHTNAATGLTVTFRMDAGDSTTTAYDTVTGFDVGTGALLSDTLDLSGTAVIGTVATQNDFGTITSSTITAGVVQFDDAAGYTTALVINSTNLADVVGYLALNTAAEDTVAFAFDSTGNGTADSTMVFHNETSTDTLVLLSGLTGVDALLTTNATGANDLFIM